MIASTTKLNTPGVALGTRRRRARADGRDGLRPAGPPARDLPWLGVGATIEFARVPLHRACCDSRREGHVTGASARNWAGYGGDVDLAAPADDSPARCSPIRRRPAACSSRARPSAADDVLAIFRHEGFAQAAVIGEIVAGAARVECVEGA